MTSSNQGQTYSDNTGVEQRRFKRYAVRLNGVCHIGSGADIGCEIQDVCLSGMYIILRQQLNNESQTALNINDIIQIECFLPGENKRQTIYINARVVRCYENGVGIAFDNPSPDTVDILNNFISTSMTELAPPSDKANNTGSQPTYREREQLIQACSELLVDQSESIARKFLSTVDEKLFIAAREAKNDTEQNSYFDAQSFLKQSHESFLKSFQNSVLAQIQPLLAKKQSNETQNRIQSPIPELSIMGNDSFENWLAIKNIVNHARLKHHDLLMDLEQRLVTLFQKEINADNNPFGPELFVHAFDNALQQIGLDHQIDLFCYSVFEEALTDILHKLYISVNNILDKNGIQPEPRVNVIKKPERETPTDNVSQAKNTTKITTPTQTDTETSSKSPDILNKGNNSAGVSSGPIQETSKQPANHEASPQTQGSKTRKEGSASYRPEQQKHSTENTHSDKEHHDIYKLVNELRQLKNKLHEKSDSTEANTSTLKKTTQNTPFSTDDIMSALSALQNQEQTTPGNHSTNRSLASRATEILRKKDKETGLNRTIDDRDSNIMDVTGNIFNSLLHDMMVADSVRQWIRKMEIPMLKMALKDDSVFADKNHVARQVLNKISQLEGYTNNNNNGAQNAIWKKINHILDKITNNIDSNPNVFDQALNEVNSLVKIQDQAYSENIQDVINACEIEYAGEQNNKLTANDTIIGNRHQWQPWEKQARRLNIGDWLVFSDSSSESQRLRLAWLSRDFNHYVFVNLRGLKEIALNFKQLSTRLRDSTAIVMESANEPALDRAQHSMLDKVHKQLIHESTHDQLTGLINRREFERSLEAKLSQHSEEHYQDVLCHLDIVQFNIINSTYGYDAGDKILIDFTNLLLRTLNGNGLLARIDGNSYTLLLENKTAADARKIIQNQINTLENFQFQWQDKELKISMNIGMVPITDYEATASELLRTAEISCRTAKEKGSNNIHIYQRNDKEAALHQHIIQQVLQIENTIKNGNIELFCQRIAAINTHHTNVPHHSEILIRVKDDEGNMIPTQDFILAAEHYHRITILDRWVIASTLEWMAHNRGLMANIGSLAINLSGKSLNDETFLTYVLDQINRANVPAEWICFEITETAGIEDLSDASEFIKKIKNTGCHFSLDDFGSGLSSYTYLKNLPVDYLKIDGAFVKNMHENVDDYAVVKSICEIGHFMGKKIIAEFVENDTILGHLRDIGVDYAQGYGIEKPRPLNSDLH